MTVEIEGYSRAQQLFQTFPFSEVRAGFGPAAVFLES